MRHWKPLLILLLLAVLVFVVYYNFTPPTGTQGVGVETGPTDNPAQPPVTSTWNKEWLALLIIPFVAVIAFLARLSYLKNKGYDYSEFSHIFNAREIKGILDHVIGSKEPGDRKDLRPLLESFARDVRGELNNMEGAQKFTLEPDQQHKAFKQKIRTTRGMKKALLEGVALHMTEFQRRGVSKLKNLLQEYRGLSEHDDVEVVDGARTKVVDRLRKMIRRSMKEAHGLSYPNDPQGPENLAIGYGKGIYKEPPSVD